MADNNPRGGSRNFEGGSPSAAADALPTTLPERIGRYRVVKLLGAGGFGLVYLAQDDQLGRAVAIKVPHVKRAACPDEADSYLSEARTVASLEHPHIVPVYDVGRTADDPFFIVSKYVEGTDLAATVRARRLGYRQAAELTATIADALHYAHKQGVVHRDIKPGNILLDQAGQPYLTDFGLALREQRTDSDSGYSGTPPYMSPEQANGEGHRVDGRSDIFSLGIVFYELLVGRGPFEAETVAECLAKITSVEARPPRQWDDAIPKELERICLKSLAKRATERYTTAKDLADDLREWVKTRGAAVVTAEVETAPLAPASRSVPVLGKDVFVSHGSADGEIASRLCQLLEADGIGCWIAPRDVTPGADYGEAIIRAIEETAATLLLLSAHANASVHVTHEVERSINRGKRVIPVRLEDVHPGPSLELHLATAHWIDGWRLPLKQVAAQLAPVVRAEAAKRRAALEPVSRSTDRHALRVVPKGLRSFGPHDADFFLELLPGPRDRDGLPDSIRFWKTLIEETDADNTCAVGLIYGPSGCGKSSLVKAGLLPRLSDDVLPIYVEATAEETEVRLLSGLRKALPALPAGLALKDVLAGLRRGSGVAARRKVLIVIDQFEQWLHARRGEQNTELVQALRQCDGGRLQCVVMVRDDFWLAISRFLRELEIRLVEGQNSALIDRFDPDHAAKVLAAFGRAFGRLPEKPSDMTREQQEFLSQAVAGLAQEGKVICVRLALFADMMKGKAWTPACLKEVGGMEGVGARFLEETFSAATAPPEHRYHQKAARAVLQALLPDSGSDLIKGHMRSRQMLVEASGYGERPKDFRDLIDILDTEVRLVTPTEPEGTELVENLKSNLEEGHAYYQLTHDYLVHSLRDWLTRKQKETRRGRAELRLADRVSLWKEKRETRYLPSLWEYLNIRLLTDKKKWTEPQRRMMGKAERLLGTRVSIAAALVIGIFFGALDVNGRFQARSIVKRLMAADIAEVPNIVPELNAYRPWADPLLRQEDAQAPPGSSKKLHLALALLPVDGNKVDELRDRLTLVSPPDFPVVRDALLPHKSAVVEPLWNLALDPKQDVPRRFQAAAALATYAPDDSRWDQVKSLVAGHLVSLETSALVAWRDALRPAKGQLVNALGAIYRDAAQKEQSRIYATETLADFARGRPEVLFALLADAEPFQFELIFKTLAEQKQAAIPLANSELGQPLLGTNDRRESLAKRQANAAVALLRLGSPDRVWALLKPVPELISPGLYGIDPRIRSTLLHRLAPLGVPPQMILRQLDLERDATIRAVLVLALGELSDVQLSAAGLSSAKRDLLSEKLLAEYETEPDAGLHGALEWLLRKWGKVAALEAAIQTLQSTEPQLQVRKSTDSRRWYVNTQKQTFVIVDADQFWMGSSLSETDREPMESPHREQIGRRFAISSHETTKEQFDRFQSERSDIVKMETRQFVKTADSPQVKMSWYEAAAYCNWLSEREGIPKAQWCYEPNAQGKYAAGMKAKTRFWELGGYRLPTEAEWEYACRAGTLTSRYYGATEELLPQYARYSANGYEHTWPVGSLKPNELGLFDMLGNVWEWCSDVYASYPAQAADVSKDVPATGPVADGDHRMMRGGAFSTRPRVVRSAIRYELSPDHREFNVGFRVARTYP